MTTQTLLRRDPAPKLKETSGWFAAGISFKRALISLSDGAFKLFAYIVLEADRRTGRFESTQSELARVLRKSRRVIGRYVAELERGSFCTIGVARNQYAGNKFEILDEYWPYERATIAGSNRDRAEDGYIVAVRDMFLKTGCTCGTFGPGDVKTARALRDKGVPLPLLRDALNLGACRKYDSWLRGGKSQPIGSLTYFEAVVLEIQERPLPPGYPEYLQGKVVQLSSAWAKESAKEQETGKGDKAPGR